MPRWDFKCTHCGQIRKDVWMSVAREGQAQIDIAPCEDCGGPLEKIPAAPAVQFKGSGWTPKHFTR